MTKQNTATKEFTYTYPHDFLDRVMDVLGIDREMTDLVTEITLTKTPAAVNVKVTFEKEVKRD